MSREEVSTVLLAEEIVESRADRPLQIATPHRPIEVIPIFPGCNVSPSKVLLEEKEGDLQAKFWITPMAEGNLDEARVEVWQDGGEIRRWWPLRPGWSKTPGPICPW